MKLTVPVSAPEEIVRLKAAGAGEIYCGFMPPEWQKRYGSHDSISRRQGEANIQNIVQFRKIAELTAELCLPSWLTLNGQYIPEQYPMLLSIVSEWEMHGGKGLILRDMGLLYHLQSKKIPLKLAASLLTVCVNTAGVCFLKSMGVSRVVLPRFLSIEEMKSIACDDPDMEYECMIMADRCPMIDGFCRGLHTLDSRSCPPLCSRIPRKSMEPCGVCRIHELMRAGIHFGKIGGRGTPLEHRYRQTAFCSFAVENNDPLLLRRVYQQIFRHECDCYYPGGKDGAL